MFLTFPTLYRYRMKKYAYLIFCLIGLASCSQKKSSTESLSNIDKFVVSLNLSPYEKFDQKMIQVALRNNLSKIGEVKIIDKTNQPEKSPPILYIDLGGYKERTSGSVKVISEVIVPENEFKTACSIWEFKYQPESVIPIETPAGIAFEKRKAEFVSTSPEATIEYMVKQFESEYKKMNPNSTQPVFFFHIQD